MSKTVLEQALEHLLNKEEDKASSLLHDYYVGIGRKVYEDIMTDDADLEQEESIQDVTDAIDEVEAELTEEGDEEEMGDEEAAAEMGDDMGVEPESEPVNADAADVADAMVDVESALAKLKAEFEEMLGGEAESEEGAEAEMGAEEMPAESIEESVDLEKVAAPDNGDKADNTNSPVAGANDMGGDAVKFGGKTGEGVASGTTPAKAPKAQDLGGTTKPAMAKVKA
jgi:hypothetical protein